MFLLSLHQQKTIKNYQNFLAKDLVDQRKGINIKQKSESKNGTNKFSNLLSSNFVKVNRLDVLVIYFNGDYKIKKI